MGADTPGSAVLSTLSGMIVAALVAVLGFSTLSAAGIGSTPLRAAFALVLGVVVAQYYERL